MIVRIQYCVDGTGDVKFKWAVYVATNTLTFKNFSMEFTQVSCFYLGYFKTWFTHQVFTFLLGVPIGIPCFKTTFLFSKRLWFQTMLNVQYMSFCAFLWCIQLKLSSEVWVLHNFVFVHKNFCLSLPISFYLCFFKASWEKISTELDKICI